MPQLIDWTHLIGPQLGHVVSSRQSSKMSDENQQQPLTPTQVMTQSHAPLKHRNSLRNHNDTTEHDLMKYLRLIVVLKNNQPVVIY